jgi:hypothetical protein
MCAPASAKLFSKDAHSRRLRLSDAARPALVLIRKKKDEIHIFLLSKSCS